MSPELLLPAASPAPAVAVDLAAPTAHGGGYSVPAMCISFMASLMIHLWLLVAGAFVMVAAPPEPRQRVVVWEGSAADQLSADEPISWAAPLAPFTQNAWAESLSPVATYALPDNEPAASTGATPRIELQPLSGFVADDSWLDSQRGSGAGPGTATAHTGDQGADDVGASEKGASGGNPQGAADVEFFGAKAQGDQFVFVCDCSRSMSGLKWLSLRRELDHCIEQLGPTRSFYIVFFDGDMHPMCEPFFREPGLLPATSENLEKVRQWLNNVSLGANTSPLESMKYALAFEPDAIFLLTDGEFSDYTAPYVRDFSRRRKTQEGKRPIAVHTVGLMEKKHQQVLRRIARDSGGSYTFVAGTEPAFR
jgi:hypothetical protein